MGLTPNVVVYFGPTYSTSITVTPDVMALPIFTDTGDGQINSAQLKLDSLDGEYITGTNKIERFDRVKIRVLDDAFATQYERVYEVDKILPSRDKQEGTIALLQLVGLEVWLQRVNCAINTFGKTTRELYTELIHAYNYNKTTYMPTLAATLTDIPDIMPNLDWSSEDTVYNRLMELVDSFGASGENNGVLDFYDVRFSVTTPTLIDIQIFSSGDTTRTSYENITEYISMDGDYEDKNVTMIAGYGSQDAGSLPYEFSKWKSRQQIMPTEDGRDALFPDWVSGQSYPTGSKVVYLNTVWNSLVNNNTFTPGTPLKWAIYSTGNYYGNAFKYSPWTDDKATLWKNNGAGFTGVVAGYPTGGWFFDGNIIINDTNSENGSDGKKTFRTWVDYIYPLHSTTESELLYDGLSVYEGLRRLNTTDGNIYEYKNSAWTIKYTPQTDMMVACLHNARVYKYSGGAWNDISTNGNALDCFHPCTSITNTESVFKDPSGTQYASNNTNSAVTVRYDFSPVEDWVKQTFYGSGGSYYSCGAWINFRFPFPVNTFNGISEDVGDLFGGGFGVNEQPVPELDAENMQYTPSGKVGFNQLDSENLGPLSSIDFMTKLRYVTVSGVTETKVLAGDFNMRCWVIDRNDHVAFQDFVIAFNDNWQSVNLPLSGFQIYRGRKPRSSTIFDIGFIPFGLDATEIFEWRHVKMICIGTKDSYDENGRYQPAQGVFGTLTGLPIGANKRIYLSIDAFRFTKPLLAITSPVSDYLIETQFLQRPNIFNYEQLKSDVASELEKQQHPYDEVNLTTDGVFTTHFGQYYYFNDPYVVTRNDDSVTNRIKLVARHIEYSWTKPLQGMGGVIRKIRGVRRYVG